MFEIINVSKKFGNEFALNSVTMKIGKGLNFIIGASGSGKTTLLKIISGMEQQFDGEVFYEDKNIKTLSDNEKSFLYNNTFGFVWQDFNLLEDLTVIENILLPQYLKSSQNKNEAQRILKSLKISELADQKVRLLSGGQKQRVAIARELMKNPKVIIADEPTSALDEKSSSSTMQILREIAKSRTVIIVTHDTSLIDTTANVFELDKGELTSSPQNEPTKSTAKTTQANHNLSAKNALKMAGINTKSKFGRFAITSISLLVSAMLLLMSVSGTIGDSSKDIFDNLLSTYGEGILDISLAGSFMSASGGDSEDKPNADVTQDIGGLYDKYINDDRVAHVLLEQPFDEIKVTVDGKEYDIEKSGNVPVLNKLLSGKMPTGNNDVVVPRNFVEKMGLSPEQAIGKAIEFKGSITKWIDNNPVLKPTKTTATIVGVADTDVFIEYEGKINEYSIDDSFFFSKSMLDDMRKQAGMESGNINFVIRAKTPQDLIAIKDELNADGIVPLGRFELVEDMVRLNSQTSQQSGSATIIIATLSVVLAIAVAMISAVIRKREYAIYKVSGFKQGHLAVLTMFEYLLGVITSAILFAVTSPLLNMATTAFFKTNILSSKMILTGILLNIVVGSICYLVTLAVILKTNAVIALKTGDR